MTAAAAASTHLQVPIFSESRLECLGPTGSTAHVARVIRMLQGRWKIAILFRLYADPSIRSLRLKRDMPDVSQKVLTQQLRELEADGLVERTDYGERPLKVEYKLTEAAWRLLPVLIAAREFSRTMPEPEQS